MGSGDSIEEGVSRTKIGILGIDIVTIKGADAVRKALDCGDLVRLLSEEDSSISGDHRGISTALPWLFARYMECSRFFFSSSGSWFLPMREETHHTYPPCRVYMDKKFVVGSYDMTTHVNKAVDLILSGKATEQELASVSVDAIYGRFLPPPESSSSCQHHPPTVPLEIIQASMDQLGGVGDSFWPPSYHRGKEGVTKVYKYAQDNLDSQDLLVDKDDKKSDDNSKLPPEVVVDVAHSILTTAVNFPKCLRAIGEDSTTTATLEQTLGKTAPTENVIRRPARDTNLGGLLAEPAIQNKTVVLINIREAAQQAETTDWVFGTGNSNRRCAAEPVLMEFFGKVHAELKKRQTHTTIR